MKNIIKYEQEVKNEQVKNRRVPKWAWIGAGVFLLLLFILALSIEQAFQVQQYISEPRMLVLSYFSYNLIVAAIFFSLIGSFLAVLIYLLSKIFLAASLFFSFIFIALLAPFIIPFFIKTSQDIAPSWAIYPNLVEQGKFYEEKIEGEKNMKAFIDEKNDNRLLKEELERLQHDALDLQVIPKDSKEPNNKTSSRDSKSPISLEIDIYDLESPAKKV